MTDLRQAGLRFWGFALILNGILAISRWLVRPWAGSGQVRLQIAIGTVVFALFFTAAYLLADYNEAPLSERLIKPSFSAVGGILLMAWSHQLSLWDSWLIGMIVIGIVVPFLLLATKHHFVLSLLMAFLIGTGGATLLRQTEAQGIYWLIAGAVILFFFWFWFRQRDVRGGVGLYTAVAMITFLQLLFVLAFLPLNTGVALSLTPIVIFFVTVCWVAAPTIR